MKSTGLYPRLHAGAADIGAVGHAGGVMLTETMRATGLDRALSEALAPWRKPMAVHDPGKIIADLALTLALGGDTLADVATLRAEPDTYGPVASDPTVSRLITLLATDAGRALSAIFDVRHQARTAAWRRAGIHAPNLDVSSGTPLGVGGVPDKTSRLTPRIGL